MENEYSGYEEHWDEERDNDYEVPTIYEIWDIAMDVNFNLNITVRKDKNIDQEIIVADNLEEESKEMQEALNHFKEAVEYLIKKVKREL